MRDKKGKFIKGHNKGGVSPNKGNKHSLESKKKISQGNKGKKVSQEIRKKISIANLGKTVSSEVRMKISNTKKGKRTPWMENRVISELTKKRMSSSKINLFKIKENHPRWKGDKVGYRALHIWVLKVLGRPLICKHCGKEKTTLKSIHWANKSYQYKRELNDWISLCVRCHKKYDQKYRRSLIK